MASVQDRVAEDYTDGGGLIHAYPSAPDSEYLSESIGLYMEYLVLEEDEKGFTEQVSILENCYIAEDEGFYFVRWRLDGEAAVNALIDDLRIIAALEQAAETFDVAEYEELAAELSLAVSTFQKRDGGMVDFYDWAADTPASRLTLSYLIDSGLIPETSAELLEQAGAYGVFFPEYYDVNAGEYVLSDEVHMIDQLLIALNRERRGMHSEAFLEWLKEQWDSNQRLHGRYGRETLEPNAEYESLAVYAYLHDYFAISGERELASEVLERSQQLVEEGILADAHFFDFIHYELMLARH